MKTVIFLSVIILTIGMAPVLMPDAEALKKQNGPSKERCSMFPGHYFCKSFDHSQFRLSIPSQSSIITYDKEMNEKQIIKSIQMDNLNGEKNSPTHDWNKIAKTFTEVKHQKFSYYDSYRMNEMNSAKQNYLCSMWERNC